LVIRQRHHLDALCPVGEQHDGSLSQ
jgi:hypothetical protein